MVSKIHTEHPPLKRLKIKFLELESSNFCMDCIYHWCSKKSKVTFCTMKSKGLFECRSCMLKLIEHYS